MKTLRISVDQISEYSFLEFGERGENAVTEVILDFAAWVEEFGEGIVNLYVKRSGDTSAYPVLLSVDGTVATWLVSDTDTYKKGRGEAEYVYVVDEKVEKTAVFGFYVNRDIGQPSTTPPSPYETWLETLMELSNNTLQNAQDAEDAKEDAEAAASHYPIIEYKNWQVWDVEKQEYVDSGVQAEGKNFYVKETVATAADLPMEAEQGDYYNVGTEAPYSLYMWEDGYGWIYQGQLQGPEGTTFLPHVSEEGIISWTNNGGKRNPEPKSIRGPQGIQGIKGETGDAAGFGTPTATVDQTIGQASVSVSVSGPDTAKVFNFEFSGIKGERGEKGETGEQGKHGETGDAAGFGLVTASVDANVGTPSVTVTSSGPNTAKVFDFQFKNIKGQKGEQGSKGDTGNGITGVSLVSTSGLDKTYRITFAETSPFEFVVHDGRGISSVVLNSDYTLTINFTDGTNWTTPNSIRGEKGETGKNGETGTTFTPSVSSAGVISWTNDGGKSNPSPVNIKGPQGLKGDNGDAAGFGTLTASVDANTGTPSVTVTASGPNTAKAFDFQFSGIKGEEGKAGENGTTFTPSVSSEGVVSWTNDGGLPNPSPVNIRGPQGGQGEDGTDGVTFTPSVSSEGVVSWTNDGGKENPPSVNIKGPQGTQGDPGANAGFGTPTASVDQTVGTPSVVVTATGPDTAKVFDFRFSGLKGETGQQGPRGETGKTGTAGAAAGFGTPTATVGTGTGTPSVSVTASGPDTAKVFNFSFDGLKGAPGVDAPEKQTVILHLACDGSGDYQDSPAGVFGLEYEGISMFRAYMLASMYYAERGQTDSGNKNDIALVYGSYDPIDNFRPFRFERYNLVDVYASASTYDDDGRERRDGTLTFRAMSMRSDTPVIKTVTISGSLTSSDDISSVSTVSYSETTLAVQT